MMEQYKPFYGNNLMTVWLFQTLRHNIQQYQNGNRSSAVLKTISDAYSRLLPEDDKDELANKLSAFLRKILGKDDDKLAEFFNLAAQKEKEVKKSDKKVLQQKKDQARYKKKETELIKQIWQEIKYLHSQGKNLDISEDKTIRSIKMGKTDEGKPGYYEICVSGQDGVLQTLKINIKRYKTSYVTSCNFYNNGAGISKANCNFLSECGADGFVLGRETDKAVARKKISEKEFKKLVGLGDDCKLSGRYGQEFEALNILDGDDRERMKVALTLRRVKEIKYRDMLESIDRASENLDVSQMAEIAETYLSEGERQRFLTEFVDVVANDNKRIWDYMNKKEWAKSRENGSTIHADECLARDEVEYDTYYAKIKQNVISEYRDGFDKLFDFKTEDEMRHNIVDLFGTINAMGAQSEISKEVVAEIMTEGIFDAGMRLAHRNDSTHLDKMNMLLNEFGVNIQFVDLKVDADFSDNERMTFGEQKRKDRAEFENLKKEDKKFFNGVHQRFVNQVQQNYKTEPLDESIHHSIPLRYNPFVITDLNIKQNWVATGKVHSWNIDLHALVHVFDKAENLVRLSNGELLFFDATDIKNKSKKGEEITILYPMLQLKDNDGTFKDVIPRSLEQGTHNILISDDKTPVMYAKVPGYLGDGRQGVSKNLPDIERE